MNVRYEVRLVQVVSQMNSTVAYGAVQTLGLQSCKASADTSWHTPRTMYAQVIVTACISYLRANHYHYSTVRLKLSGAMVRLLHAVLVSFY